ncbi:MFS transporter [Microbispora triticiradicis]|uniref:MFS transporter n=3 Tax=Microbispora TaxID=2005 RepID=A0ABY3LWC5_9ACTN|nr:MULTISPECIES: MFS transporter [Microbispora]RGA02374.1 MFS transporter [Microbispora triticiradicis]TLP58566.1 MFS transporter [Microbispora fusca]TYB57692.1 MFS transporter [Microbispora tritici]
MTTVSGRADRTGGTGFLRSRAGGLPRPFWVLFGGSFVNRLGTMVEPFIGVYLTQARGVPLATAGLVMTMFGVGSLLAQPVAGWLSDRFGRRVTLTGGMVATAVTMLALGYTTSVPGLVAGMLVLGIVVDAYRPASQAIVADLVPPEDRPRAFGLLFWAVNLGFAVAMVAGGWLARSGFTVLFWVDAVTCLVFGVLVWRAIPETRPAREDAPPGRFADVLRDRVMLAFVLANLVYALVYLQAYSTLPLAMTGQGLPTSAYGMAMAVNGLLIVVVQPVTTTWLARFDPSRVLAAGFALVGLGFALTSLVSSGAGHAATVAVWTLGEALTAGIPGAIVATLAPAHLRGRYSGLYGLSWSAGALLAPLVGTRLLADAPGLVWPVLGGLGLLAAGAQLLLGRAVRRRSAA